MPPVPVPLPYRFWPKVDQSAGPDGCWPWSGAISLKRSGTYRGAVRHAGRGSRMLLAHRVALWLLVDPNGTDIVGYDRPDLPGYQACHTCGNRLCCNPAHLYWGTRADNDRDRYSSTAASVVAATFDEEPAA